MKNNTNMTIHKYKHSIINRLISSVLIVSFIVLDISYAYPAEQCSHADSLAVSSISDSPSRKSDFIFKEAILAIGKQLLGDPGNDVKPFPIGSLAASVRLMGPEAAAAIVLAQISLSDDGVVTVPCNRDGVETYIYIALKDNPAASDMGGIEWDGISKHYIVREETASAARIRNQPYIINEVRLALEKYKEEDNPSLDELRTTEIWRAIKRYGLEYLLDGGIGLSDPIYVRREIHAWAAERANDGRPVSKRILQSNRRELYNAAVGLGILDDVITEINKKNDNIKTKMEMLPREKPVSSDAVQYKSSPGIITAIALGMLAELGTYYLTNGNAAAAMVVGAFIWAKSSLYTFFLILKLRNAKDRGETADYYAMPPTSFWQNLLWYPIATKETRHYRFWALPQILRAYVNAHEAVPHKTKLTAKNFLIYPIIKVLNEIKAELGAIAAVYYYYWLMAVRAYNAVVIKWEVKDMLRGLSLPTDRMKQIKKIMTDFDIRESDRIHDVRSILGEYELDSDELSFVSIELLVYVICKAYNIDIYKDKELFRYVCNNILMGNLRSVGGIFQMFDTDVAPEILDIIEDNVNLPGDESPHHFPLYIWEKLRPALYTALKEGKISKETHDLIVHDKLGAARFSRGQIIIEDEALDIIAGVLNEVLARGPPNRLTPDDVRRYLTYHERLHQRLRASPNTVQNLLAKLRARSDFNEIKQGFINNYGEEYRDDAAFAEELLVVHMTERHVLKQDHTVYIVEDLNNPKDSRREIPHDIVKLLNASGAKRAIRPELSSVILSPEGAKDLKSEILPLRSAQGQNDDGIMRLRNDASSVGSENATEVNRKAYKPALSRRAVTELKAMNAIAYIRFLATRARDEDKEFIIGIDTDCISGLDLEGGSLQAGAIRPLLQEIDKLEGRIHKMGLTNVRVIHGKGDALAFRLIEKAKKSGFHNIAVMAPIKTVKSMSFKALREADANDRPFIAAINPEKLEKFYAKYGEDSDRQIYIRLTEMLYLTLELATGAKMQNRPPIIEYYDEVKRLVIFTPLAERIDIESLGKRYRLDLEALAAA